MVSKPGEEKKRVSDESFTEVDLITTVAIAQNAEQKQRKPVTAGCLFCHKWWTPVLWLIGVLILGVGIAAIVVFETEPWRADEPSFALNNSTVSYPFVYIDELIELMKDERGVTVLDARRSDSTFTREAGLGKTIPGAARAWWEDFLDGGVLKSPEAIAADFRSRGVFNDRPVVVYGGWSAANYWGEEGRIWWQLSWLNHTEAYILYGGIWAWDDRKEDGVARSGETGDFVARPVASRYTDTEQLAETIRQDPESVFIVDAREVGEYDGANPYNNAYGGHIPGAKSYHWRDAFTDDGNLRPREEVRATLLSLGFRDGMSLVAYCTRGVRASFLNSVLTWAGFETATYAGSWKEWSAAIPKDENEQLEADL